MMGEGLFLGGEKTDQNKQNLIVKLNSDAYRR